MASITPTPEVEPSREEKPPPRGRGWLWAVLVMVLVLGGVAVVFGLLPVSSTSQDERIDGEVGQLIIDVTGSVSLTAGEQTDLRIERKWALGGEPMVEVTEDNGVIRVSGECPWLPIRCTTSVSGTVTADAVIVVRTSAGSVLVSGTTSGVDLETSAGSVRAENVVGRARLHSAAGHIIGTVTDGDVDAETSAGRIELTALGDFSSISARTSAGNIELTLSDEVYEVDADTAAGSVNINVRTDPSAERHIVANSSAGSITIKPAP